jgi:hypothetical protein
MLIDPKTVVSPKGSVRNLEILWDGGEWNDADPLWSGWSAAKLDWDGHPAIGIRWNGTSDDKGVGNPQSRGLPTWFILPDPIADVALARIAEHLRNGSSNAELPPRQRLLDLILFVRAASDTELTHWLDLMELKPRNPAKAA